MKLEAAIGMMCPEAQECQQPIELGRLKKKKKDSPREPQGGMQPRNA